MTSVKQSISGNNNIQVGGDIKTERIIHRTEVVYDKDTHISSEQALSVREHIQKLASELSSQRNGFSLAYNTFYKHFKIPTYKVLPKERYDEAIEWINKQIAINRNKLKRINPDQWRKDMYKSIHARANELGIDIHDFANDVLNPKCLISSLTELSDLRLKKLYQALFGIRK
ncbi:MAG: ORF6C domain-containing protein [Bacteroidales bacterium]|nr:ORF6C domain-containing protein [Bacteroidales bacterium]